MSTLFDLSRLRSGSEHLERRYEADEFPSLDDEFRVISPVDLRVDATKEAKKIRLVGRVTATLECTCGRCLDPLQVPVEADFDSVFLPAVEPGSPVPEQEIGAEDLSVGFYQDDVIDMAEVMREQFYLALPMKPLCRADCKGLCPICGINRNRETCSCRAEWVDPRLEVLRRFKE